MNFIKVLITALLLASLLAATPTLASSQTGKITRLAVRDADGLIYVELTGARSQKPACAANFSYWMIKNENSETGKRQHATLLAAMLARQTIAITGHATCTRWGDGEDIHIVEVLAD